MKKQQKTAIDFSKYQTPELVITIVDIISLPGSIRSIVKWVFYGLFALMALVFLGLKLTGNLTLFWTFVFESYAVPAGSLGGLALGIAEFIRRSLNNMTKLIDLLIQTTSQVVEDIRGLYKGERELPPTRDLVEGVYEQVILVALREAIFMVFGFLGRPIYWIYHLTLNQFVRFVILRLIPRSEVADKQVLASLTEEQIATSESVIQARLKWVQDGVDTAGTWLRTLVMLPCYIILLVILAAIFSPIFLTWWFFMSGDVPPGA